MSATTPLAVFLFFLMVTGTGCAQNRSKKQGERKPPVEIEITLPKEQFLTVEEILLNVRIHNNGAGTVEVPDPSAFTNPQPVYHLSGPSLAKPLSAGLASDDSRGPMLVPLAPGSTTEGDVSLTHLTPLDKPGVYTVSASLEWKGVSARSRELRFTRVTDGFRFFGIAAKAHDQATYPIPVAAAGGSAMYVALYDEDRPDLGEIVLKSVTHYASFDPAATDFFTPAAMDAGLASARYGWLAKRRVAVTGWNLPVQTLDLTFDARLVKPSLMAANGNIDVLLLDGAGANMSLARFPYAAQDRPGSVMWTTALPDAAQSSSATIGPSGARYAVFLTSRQKATVITVAEIGDRGAKFRSTTIPDSVPLKNANPAIHVSGSGTIRVSCLLMATGSTNVLHAAELRWNGESEPKIARGNDIKLAADPQTATTTYSVAGSGDPLRAWLVLLADGSMINHLSLTEPQRPDGKIVTPLQLLQMSENAYYLVTDSAGKPQMRLVH